MNRNIFFLYQLCRAMKPGTRRVNISTTLYGESLGMSQQSASRHLKELEDEGFVRRMKTGRGMDITLTPEGCEALKGLYVSLKGFIEEKEPKKTLSGTVAKGLGEGAYYVREYAQEIEKKLECKPFHGTLNIKPLEGMPNIVSLFTGTIKGFRKKGRTFGSIRYAKIKLTAKGKTEYCYVILPTRTHHKDTLEIISRHNLRERMSLSDGDRAEIEFVD